MNKIVPSLVEEDKRDFVRYTSVDATNYESLEAALSGVEEEICITCECLLMYLTNEELGTALDNIHRLVRAHGGHFITADPEIAVQHTNTLHAIDAEQKLSFVEGMKACSYWQLACDAAPKQQHVGRSDIFSMRTSCVEGMLTIGLSGRLDTLTAPDLLELYENTLREQPVRRVEIDCRNLAYMSSAGIRTLVIMCKRCPDGVALSNASDMVAEAIRMTGIDQLVSLNA